MAQRRHHYEAAFEHLLRSRRIPYIAVDEAKKSLVPSQVDQPRWTLDAADSIKSFDFVVYGRGTNVLAEVKGRRLAKGLRQECWVTEDDVASFTACWTGVGHSSSGTSRITPRRLNPVR